MKLQDQVDYYNQDIKKMWSGKTYDKYKTGIHYSERDVPYTLNQIVHSEDTVLEVGSAMGQCYRWLLSRGVDLGKRYTGTDISDSGLDHCRNLYPQANWKQGDFIQTEFEHTYDYVHERNAIHHMPRPIECIQKAVNLATKKALVNLRSLVYNPTISDLDRSYYVQYTDDDKDIKAKYFCNFVNVSEVINAVLELKDIKSVKVFLSPYEQFTNQAAPTTDENFVAPPEVYDSKESIYHCLCVVEKGWAKNPSVDISYTSKKQAIKNPQSWFRFLKDRKHIFKNIKKVH